MLESITAGIAKRIMNETTSIDHANIGIRLSDIPGARSLKIVTINDVAITSDESSENVMSCAHTSARFPTPYCGPASGT